ncbi:hypothetical protein [Marinigracilibium pacificum]|uniref:Uncharacterized protein n=1 Tax=Marinigracilibium pacificum TaxID=2729599 RepID=A0A848J4T8_9BACT|nr:hypothetical protein [Marinigracilibium pacificum]NMM49474.1 hypothetical protein [Marinigracilibium pacificum]
MALISKKKIPFQISNGLRSYLHKHDRSFKSPIKYSDLLRFNSTIALYDRKGDDTLWETVFYSPSEMGNINESLKKIYALLKSDGDLSVIEHLFIDRVDICPYGNSMPFRVRIVNQINDNFDYFYVKKADASRIYGLELEHHLSPNRINYLVDGDTLIEEHIAGVPGDQFIITYLRDPQLNKIRLAKEFVKFNERCFVRLLGDMHSSNFVIDITPDFEEIHYRIRSIDFDQQSYEGRKAIYMPKYFKQNYPLIKLGLETMTPESVRQYQKEERALIVHRIRASRYALKDLIDVMIVDKISLPENVESLKKELADHYEAPQFLECNSMGEIVKQSLKMLLRNI